MPTSEAAILERIIELEKAELTPDAARYLLTLDFPKADRGPPGARARREGIPHHFQTSRGAAARA